MQQPIGSPLIWLTTLREQRKWPTSSGNSTLRLCYSTISCTYVHTSMHVPGVHMQRNWHSLTTGAPLDGTSSRSLFLGFFCCSVSMRPLLCSPVFWAQLALVTIWYKFQFRCAHSAGQHDFPDRADCHVDDIGSGPRHAIRMYRAVVFQTRYMHKY